MALSTETVERLAVVESTACYLARDRFGKLPIPRELAAFLVALTEEVERLDRRVTELEAAREP